MSKETAGRYLGVSGRDAEVRRKMKYDVIHLYVTEGE